MPPTMFSAAVFALKVAILRCRRSVLELGRRPRLLERAIDPAAFGQLISQSRTALWNASTPGEAAFDYGKVHNLRRAAMRLDHICLPAGSVFSFWRQVGRTTRGRGYVVGRMLQEGCLVPSIGGGLCQLSNALYDVALGAGCRIVERHAHSRVVPGSAAAAGSDATVAWNYVDLRFEPSHDLLLTACLDQETLTVSLWAKAGATTAAKGRRVEQAAPTITARNCASCGELECFRHEGRRAATSRARTAFVVDAAWPEFRRYVEEKRRPGDIIALPLDGRRWGRERYGWETRSFDEVIEARLAALLRAVRWRATPAQGPVRRAAEIRSNAALANALGPRLGPEVTEVVVAQSLLPFLWRAGWLGGRAFSVLANRMPMVALQHKLNDAHAAHPERVTLADFRAPAWLGEAEGEALDAAQRIVTPHREVADLYGERAEILDWTLPAPMKPTPPRKLIAFPGPTVARKGAYEVREAALKLGLAVRPMGAELEGAGFWNGLAVEPAPTAGCWLDGVAAVVQPALIEEAPRRLLAALASGAPVIASPACGLPPQAGLTLAAADDAAALAAAIETVLPTRAGIAPISVHGH